MPETPFPLPCPAIGFVSCGPVVLVFDLMCKSGTYYSPSGMVALFRLVALQTSLGLAAAFWLVLRHRKQLAGVRYLGAALEPLKSSSTGKVGRWLLGRMWLHCTGC